MASPYQQDFKTAEVIGAEFTDTSGTPNVVLGNLAVTATNAAVTVTLAFTPTFVLHSQLNDASGTFTVTTSGTTTGLTTFTRSTTTTATTIAYFAGILA